VNYDNAHRPDATGSTPGSNTPDSGSRSGTYFLGRYRVVDEIGIGGMASVHLGRMDGPGGFQKWVAIKRIHAHLIEDDSFVQMFLDEARVAARISHPNVATVFELGKHDDSYWIAMEYLHGEPLRELMRRTEEIGSVMPPEIACRIIADAAEGLHAAHELTGKNGERLNLVHRDVTPHNLFVTYDGTTKVVDFGIAKFSSRMSSTRAGTLKGKLAYMSPEQVHGEQIDRRTDIFALGVVLWELTTGQRLFRMESDLDTLAKVQECNVQRPSTLVRGYPIDLEKIVMKALSKNRGERFKTAREFSRALQGLLMRRGLFIASDEVAGYVQSIFSERIQKREAHLRWAAEVTQTINIDRPAIGLVGSREASVSADNRPAAEVRPAAGARPTIQGMGPNDSGPNTSPVPNTARHSPTVRPPSRADHNGPPQDSGPYPTLHDAEEFDDSDATIITVQPREQGLAASPVPAAGRLGDSGETHAMPQNQLPNAQRNQPAAFAATMDARNIAMQSRPEFHQVAQTPGNQGLGMNLMGSRNAPTNMSLGDPLPMSPFHQSPHASSPNLANLLPNASVSSPMIRLAPLEFGGAMDNRTITAQALRRGVPLWAVAAGSAIAALMLVTMIYFVAVHSSSDSTKPIASGPASGSSSAPLQGTAQGTSTSPGTPASGTVGVVSIGSGPFGGARAAFSHAIDIAPVPPPAPPPQPTASATPSAAPVTTAAVTAAAAAQPAQPVSRGPTRTAPPDAQGMLTVVCSPACDQVIDNGKMLGPAPIFRLKVPVGEHHLQLKNGKLSKVANKIVTAGDLQTVLVTMQ
jgi:serine/threonine-protein kinase